MCPPYLLIVDLDVRDLYPDLYIRRAPHRVEQRPGQPTRMTICKQIRAVNPNSVLLNAARDKA